METRIPGLPVADGIGQIPGFVNAYAVWTDGGFLLVDAGFAARAGGIRRAFARADVPLDRIRAIVLTHHHVDHRGGAPYLHRAVSAPVACHRADAPYVEHPRSAGVPFFLRWLAHRAPVPVRALEDRDPMGPFQLLHTPGHTPGEVVLYRALDRVLISGDAVVERNGRLSLPAPRYAADIRQAVASLRILRDLPVEWLLPGHGRPFRGPITPAIDRLIERWSAILAEGSPSLGRGASPPR